MKFNSKQANQQYSSFNLKDFFGMNNPCSHFLCPWSCFLLVCKSFLRPRSGIKDEAYLLW